MFLTVWRASGPVFMFCAPGLVFGCFKCNKLFEFLKFIGHITTYNFIKINIITPHYAYYMIVQLKLRYQYSMTLIMQKYRQDALETVV
jgi:hypothetical protein